MSGEYGVWRGVVRVGGGKLEGGGGRLGRDFPDIHHAIKMAT